MLNMTSRIFAFFLSITLFFISPFVSYADTRTPFLLATDSNADSFSFSAFASSPARVPSMTVKNTVDWSGGSDVLAYVVNSSGNARWISLSTSIKPDGSLFMSSVGKVPAGYQVQSLHIYYKHNPTFKFSALPPSGKYAFSLFFSSDFTVSFNGCSLMWQKDINNASSYGGSGPMPVSFLTGGDIYMSYPYVVDLANVSQFYLGLSLSSPANDFAGTLSTNFSLSSSDKDIAVGKDTSTEDYQSSVTDNTAQIADGVGEMSGTLSNMSNTMSDMASGISDVNDTLTYISDSQGLIIKGIDNIIMHISDQLYAFWDQLYNLIHVPTYAKLNEILAAIRSMDLDVTVDLDELKASISALQSAIVDKLTASTGQITDLLTKSHNDNIANDNKNHNDEIANDNKNHDDLVHGYDNTGMDSDKSRLDDAIAEYDTVEDELLGDAKDKITGFDFENPLTRFVAPLQDISYFLQGVYVALGSLNIPIGFSLTLMIALIFVGYYRFKGGG